MSKLPLIALTIALCMGAHTAYAAGCVNGVYREGCAGPNGAAVVRKPVAPVYRQPYHPSAGCASGPYRAGCAGPNGAAAARRPY